MEKMIRIAAAILFISSLCACHNNEASEFNKDFKTQQDSFQKEQDKFDRQFDKAWNAEEKVAKGQNKTTP